MALPYVGGLMTGGIYNVTPSVPFKSIRPIRCRRHLFIPLTFLLAMSMLSACASGPTTGVRSDFGQTQVQSVAIVPFYARSNFGMQRHDFAEVREIYEAITTAELRAMGFEVVDPRALRQHLEEVDLWDDFIDGIHLRQSLTTYFESQPGDPSPAVETRTLRELAQQEAFPAQTLLFVEVIYHTRGTCMGTAERYTPYARILVASGAPNSFPRPCVSSHIQAKLVDVETGQTMWFNQMFFETHARHIDDDVIRSNIAQAIQSTLGEGAGLRPLAPSGPDGVAAGSR